jgi:hypothetical protein
LFYQQEKYTILSRKSQAYGERKFFIIPYEKWVKIVDKRKKKQYTILAF